MKKKMIWMILALTLTLGIGGCGNEAKTQETQETSTDAPQDTKENQTTQESGESQESGELEEAEEQSEAAPAGVAYQNVSFDYTDEIAKYAAKDISFTTPAAIETEITVTDQQGASGVQLVKSVDEANTKDYYLNALVAGNELTFQGGIAAATSQIGSEAATELTVEEGTLKIVPAPIKAAEPVDQVITITTTTGSEYKVHTVNEAMVYMDIVNSQKAEAGVYTFVVDKFLLRVNTQGEIIYYRNVGCVGEELMSENFMAQDTKDGRLYSYFIELKPQWRNANGGFSSGMYVIMDENYTETEYVTLNANEDENHTHGEGYLDQHEFQLLGANHWISLSYTPVLVENLPGNGIDGGNTGYVHAGIIQEVKDGKVIHEWNTVDYQELYQTAKECNEYATSTDQKTADDVMDYVHVNSVAIDPKDDNLLISMRHQYAVYKINRETGEIMWILGGDNNQFSGLDDILDADGNLFIGQHYASYVDAAVAGNDSTITVFDNHTSFKENLTRTIEFVLDEEAKTATVTVIQGSELDKMTQKAHWATHCGSIQHVSSDSVLLGWGLNVVLDTNPETVNNHPIFSDYNPNTNTVEFELCVTRNPNIVSKEACFSYRTYKNAN